MYSLMNRYGIYNPEKSWDYSLKKDINETAITELNLSPYRLYNYNWLTPLLGLYGQNLLNPLVY